jgi:hypothetical protein
VTFTYDVTNHLAVPRQFGFGPLRVTFPATLPAYTLTMVVEPS